MANASIGNRFWVTILLLLSVVRAVPLTARTGRRLQQSEADEMLWSEAQSGDVSGVQEALKAGANIETTQGTYSETPLIIASTNGHLDVVKLLIDEGANMEARDKGGETSLWRASYRDDLPIALELLLAGAEVDGRKTSNGFTPLNVASHEGHLDVVKLLIVFDANLNSKTDKGFTSLIIASANGQAEVVRELLKSGANATLANNVSETALHFASATLGIASEQIVNDLLNTGIDIDVRSDSGSTPLMDAAWWGNVGTTRLLINRGANTSLEDNDGDTALVYICRCLNLKDDESKIQCPKGECNDASTKEEIANLLLSEETIEASEESESSMAKEPNDPSVDSPQMEDDCSIADCFELTQPDDRVACALECPSASG